MTMSVLTLIPGNTLATRPLTTFGSVVCSSETLACGTGACAAVVAGRQQGWLDDKVSVILPGGELQIVWLGGDEPVMMTGPAVSVFEGELNL